MKQLIILILIFSNICVLAQDDSLQVVLAPTLTAIGKPAGEKISQKIDKDGGKLITTDGRMELIIPQDAIGKKTTISIQPVTNELSGSGIAYELEPSGISFQKPLQIIFHYSSKEEAPIAELRNIAWQDDKGQWNALDSSVVDTITRTVTGNITHFSTWVFFDYFNLSPTSARVKVGHKLGLQIKCTYPGGLSANFIREMLNKMRFTTYVNGIHGGNAAVGTISTVQGGHDFWVLNYTAPASVPDNNPVAVSAEASNITFNLRTYSKLKLVSNVTVYDDSYDIKVIGHNTESVLQCTISSIDSSTCILQLNGNRSKLLEIENMDFKIKIMSCPCNLRELNPGSSTGPVNIIGASKIDIAPANPPQKPYRLITVYFIRNTGVIPGMAIDPCMGHPGLTLPAMALPAVPFVLQFEDDKKEHLVKGGDEKNGFEVRVTPIQEDQ
ncbi:MAG TPA: hypothetical protein VHD35_14030 [Chitinophagaceae bacterium]|nr:hypothetical protein [Chitinophagaceae bacterium]